MGAGLPREIITETDLSYYVDTVLKGISCVIGLTEKGPIGVPQLISSEMQYDRIFGSNLAISDFPLLCKRALSYGATLWVTRTAHYTDITKKTSLTAKSASVTIENSMKISASSQGSWGNKLKVVISKSDLDADNLFTIQVFDDSELVETLEDLSMNSETIKSSYIEIEYIGTTKPALGTYNLTGGVDGVDGICDADYIGSATNSTGLYSFDDVTDAMQLAVPGVSSPAVISAGLAYCENRGDLLFITETPFDLTPQEAVDFRLGKGNYEHAAFVSNYGALYYPKLKIYDTARQKERYISPVGGCTRNNGRK